MTRAVEESPVGDLIPLGTVSTLELPWPPSVNHYWRATERHGQRVRTRKALAYITDVTLRVRQQGAPRFGDARLAVLVRAHPPDRRARDLDNVLKGLLDALRHAGVYDDDRQIDDLRIVRDRVWPGGGRVLVTIEAMP